MLKNKKKPFKPGKVLEILVYQLERICQKNSDYKIEINKKIPDRNFGRLREVDVLLTFKSSHHSIKIAFECKDYKRKVEIGVIDGFIQKLEDINVNQGILVSKKGFAESVLEKAERYNIKCFTLEQTNSLGWLLKNTLKVYNKKITDFKFDYFTSGSQVNISKNRGLIYKATSQKFNMINIYIDTLKHINSLKIATKQKSEKHSFHLDINGTYFSLYDFDNDEIIPLDLLFIDVYYDIETNILPLDFYKYNDTTNSANIADIATTTLEFDNSKGIFSVIKQENSNDINFHLHIS